MDIVFSKIYHDLDFFFLKHCVFKVCVKTSGLSQQMLKPFVKANGFMDISIVWINCLKYCLSNVQM